MGSYRIDCMDFITRPSSSHPRGHITQVHVGEHKWSVSSVRRWIRDDGDRFYTVSPSNRKEADVQPYNCPCGVETLRSHSDAVTDNNLDNMEC